MARALVCLSLALACLISPSAHAGIGFGPRIDLAVPSPPDYVAVGDVNEDSHLDVLVSSASSGSIRIYPGNGDGTFGAPFIVIQSGTVARAQLADWDGDGHLDVVGSRHVVGQLQVHFGHGDGTFTAGPTLALSSSAPRFEVADFDGDGLPDLAGVNGTNGSSSVFVVKGAGAAGWGVLSVLETQYADVPKVLAIGEMGGNGLPDILTIQSCVSCYGRAYLSQGGMVFVPTSSFGPYYDQTPAAAAVIADLTHDGITDLAVARDETPAISFPSAVAVSVGNGVGTLYPTPVEPLSKYAGPMLLGPWGGPTESDFVCTSTFARYIALVRVSCDGQPQPKIVSPTLPSAAFALALGDIDEDGTVDVVAALHDASIVTILPVTPNDAPFACDPHLVPDTAIDFGTANRLDPDTRPVNIENPGSPDLLILSATIEGSNEFQWTSGFPETIPAGHSGHVNIRFNRTADGAHAATLRIRSNDLSSPQVAIALSGYARHISPRLEVESPQLEFGTKAAGVAETRALAFNNLGDAVLSITGATVSGAEFSILPPVPTSIAPGATATVNVRYTRANSGLASGEFHLASDDSLQPEVVIPLSGFAGPPPIAVFSALPPTTVAVGTSTTQAFVVRNPGPSPLHVTVPDGASDLAEACPQDVGTTGDFPQVRGDQAGAFWDIQANGAITHGTNDEYAGGMQWLAFAAQPSASVGLGAREFRFGPVNAAGGVMLTRKVYIPGDEPFARYVDVVENPGDVARPFTVDVTDNLGYAPGAALRSSSGDGLFDALDDWIVVPADAPPRRTTARVVATASSAFRPDAVFLGNGSGGMWSRARFEGTVPAHGRIAIAQWAVQGIDADDAEARATTIAGGSAAAFAHLDAIDRAALLNGPAGPGVFRPTPGIVTIQPGDSAEVVVTFDAASAAHEATVTGTLRLLTDDPGQPVAMLPVSLHITGGTVVGIEPADSPPGRLELAGFLPNPARTGNSIRISFRLAGTGPASLTLYDVRGRRLAHRVLERPEPGPGAIALSERLAPGVVWLRLEQEGRIVTRKGIILP